MWKCKKCVCNSSYVNIYFKGSCSFFPWNPCFHYNYDQIISGKLIRKLLRNSSETLWSVKEVLPRLWLSTVWGRQFFSQFLYHSSFWAWQLSASDLFCFFSSHHKHLCRRHCHPTPTTKHAGASFHPLISHNEDIVFCWLHCPCHPASHRLSLCVFCSVMSWTHRATDSSSLDGEWPFLQPIRCHWAPLLWSQPFREDESH